MELRKAVTTAKKFADPKGALPGHGVVRFQGGSLYAAAAERGVSLEVESDLDGVAVDAAALATTLGAIPGEVTLAKKGRSVSVSGELGEVKLAVFGGVVPGFPDEPDPSAGWQELSREDLDQLAVLVDLVARPGDSRAMTEIGSVRVSARGFLATNARRSLFWVTDRFPLSAAVGIPPEFLAGAAEEGCRFVEAGGCLWLKDKDKATWSRAYGSLTLLDEGFDGTAWRMLDAARAHAGVQWCRPDGDRFVAVLEAARAVLGADQHVVLTLDAGTGVLAVSCGKTAGATVQAFTAEVPTTFEGDPTPLERIAFSPAALGDLVEAFRALRGNAWRLGMHETSPSVLEADDGTLYGLILASRLS